VPDSFGKYGYYRGDNLQEQMNIRVPKHGTGYASCKFCHEDKVNIIIKTPHKVITCETCHAPLRVHVKYDSLKNFLKNPSNYKKTAAMPIFSAQELCVKCHDFQPAKPAGFKTVVVRDHLKEMGEEPSPNVCIDCHDPHDPVM